MIHVRDSVFDDGKLAIHFGRTVRHLSPAEALKLGLDLISRAWASQAMDLAVARRRR